MEELTLGWQLLLAILFLSAAWPKLRKFAEHAAVIKEYQMLPGGLVVPFARLEVAAEVAVGVMLLFGFWPKTALLTAAGMLMVYTAAIIVNLLRGRRQISCGCGGVVGTHALSWKLVLRNVLLLMLTVSAWYSAELIYSFGFDYWWTMLAAGAVLLLAMGTQELWAVRARMLAFFQQGEADLQSKGGRSV